MATVTWSLQALSDLDKISDFHAKTSPAYAAAVLEVLLGVESQLAQFPASGRMLPEAPVSTLREVIVRGYRIIYAHIDYERVDILLVHHSAVPLKNFPGESK